MEKIFELARKFRLILLVITIAAFALLAMAKCDAFWPPDLVPHPHIPDAPTKPAPSFPDDHISKK